MPGRTIAIGDIHGCLTALDALLEAIQVSPEDTIVTLGDYVDRGPNSKGVIDRLIELQQQCTLVPLFGNHEEMMLDVVLDEQQPYSWLRHGGVETLDSYMFSGDMSVVPSSHHDFFRTLVDHFETETHFFVHANYQPELDLQDQPVELLRWAKLTEITPGPHVNGKIAVVGHTHDRAGEIFDIGHLICLDTYCYGGGWLTAMDVMRRDVWQANEAGTVQTNVRQNSN